MTQSEKLLIKLLRVLVELLVFILQAIVVFIELLLEISNLIVEIFVALVKSIVYDRKFFDDFSLGGIDLLLGELLHPVNGALPGADIIFFILVGLYDI